MILACNDLEAAHKLREEIVTSEKNRSYGGIEVAYLDLRSFASIHEFVENFKSRNSRLKVLINNGE